MDIRSFQICGIKRKQFSYIICVCVCVFSNYGYLEKV